MKRNKSIHQHDIGGEAWEQMKALLPGKHGGSGKSQAPLLMEGLEAKRSLRTAPNKLLDMLEEADISTVIPPVKSRKEQRAVQPDVEQHVIENVFRTLKRWRRIATRYAKLTATSFHRCHSCQVFVSLPPSQHYLGFPVIRLAKPTSGVGYARTFAMLQKYAEKGYIPF